MSQAEKGIAPGPHSGRYHDRVPPGAAQQGASEIRHPSHQRTIPCIAQWRGKAGWIETQGVGTARFNNEEKSISRAGRNLGRREAVFPRCRVAHQRDAMQARRTAPIKKQAGYQQHGDKNKAPENRSPEDLPKPASASTFEGGGHVELRGPQEGWDCGSSRHKGV